MPTNSMTLTPEFRPRSSLLRYLGIGASSRSPGLTDADGWLERPAYHYGVVGRGEAEAVAGRTRSELASRNKTRVESSNQIQREDAGCFQQGPSYGHPWPPPQGFAPFPPRSATVPHKPHRPPPGSVPTRNSSLPSALKRTATITSRPTSHSSRSVCADPTATWPTPATGPRHPSAPRTAPAPTPRPRTASGPAPPPRAQALRPIGQPSASASNVEDPFTVYASRILRPVAVYQQAIRPPAGPRDEPRAWSPVLALETSHVTLRRPRRDSGRSNSSRASSAPGKLMVRNPSAAASTSVYSHDGMTSGPSAYSQDSDEVRSRPPSSCASCRHHRHKISSGRSSKSSRSSRSSATARAHSPSLPTQPPSLAASGTPPAIAPLFASQSFHRTPTSVTVNNYYQSAGTASAAHAGLGQAADATSVTDTIDGSAWSHLEGLVRKRWEKGQSYLSTNAPSTSLSIKSESLSSQGHNSAPVHGSTSSQHSPPPATAPIAGAERHGKRSSLAGGSSVLPMYAPIALSSKNHTPKTLARRQSSMRTLASLSAVEEAFKQLERELELDVVLAQPGVSTYLPLVPAPVEDRYDCPYGDWIAAGSPHPGLGLHASVRRAGPVAVARQATGRFEPRPLVLATAVPRQASAILSGPSQPLASAATSTLTAHTPLRKPSAPGVKRRSCIPVPVSAKTPPKRRTVVGPV